MVRAVGYAATRSRMATANWTPAARMTSSVAVQPVAPSSNPALTRLTPAVEVATGGVGPRLLGPINAVLGENLVKEIHVLPGPPPADRGTFAKLPFGNAGGCKGITDMLERLERQRQQEAGAR